MISYQNAKMMALEEAFPDFLAGSGIFDYLNTFAWIPDSSTALALNTEYFLNRSGRKLASPLVARLCDTETEVLTNSGITALANIITIRFGKKWNKIWSEFSNNESFLATVNKVEKTEFGKSTTETTTDELTKSGTETDTRNMTETHDESSNGVTPYTETKTISGKFTDTTANDNVRTGSELVTNRGDIKDSVYGFNSVNPVGASVSGPATNDGTTEETSYPGEGLKIADSGSRERTYTNYQEATSLSGTKTTTISYGQDGRVDEKTFTNRVDSREISNTIANDGEDKTTTTGFDFRRSADKLNLIEALYSNPLINDFFEVVYSDLDTILTCPIFM